MLWYSLEAPLWGASNEYPQHMFSWRNEKKYKYFWVELFEAILSNFFTFIDHKSRMTQMDSFEFHFYITCL